MCVISWEEKYYMGLEKGREVEHRLREKCRQQQSPEQRTTEVQADPRTRQISGQTELEISLSHWKEALSFVLSERNWGISEAVKWEQARAEQSGQRDMPGKS